jgi:predicted ATP-binding protein involved in virulence
MKIIKICIEKFRGFQEVEFTLGSHLTVIAGQNGTQKTTHS